MIKFYQKSIIYMNHLSENRMSNNLFYGLITALITPFKQGMIDTVALKTLLDYQSSHGVKNIVVGGSTGEISSLDLDEYELLIKSAISFAKNVNIIAGCGAGSTKTAIKMAQIAQKSGVSGLMCTVPTYSKPTQEGLYFHFKAIHDATTLPIMIYTVPSRTSIDIDDNTIFRLASLPRIIAMKDAGVDIERPLRISKYLPDFNILAGDDSSVGAFYAQGAKGLVSVTSNIAPKIILDICNKLKNGEYNSAMQLQHSILELHHAMFVETNPVPVKYAASLMNMCDSEVRLPLCHLNNTSKILIEKAMKDYLTYFDYLSLA